MTSNTLHLAVILGSGRAGAYSRQVARYVLELVKAAGFETTFVDCGKLGITVTNQENAFTKKWLKTASAVDGYLVVSPEYNHGYPGELKMLLDALDDECEKKPIGIIGVSSGMYGGARMVDHLRVVAVALAMVPTQRAVNFSFCEKLFDAKGALLDVSYEKRVLGLLEELAWFAQALKAKR